MHWIEYEKNYTLEATKSGYTSEEIIRNLDYAKKLYEKNIPIIYDVEHLSLLVGINKKYIYKISNSPKSGYRKFYIAKKNKGLRLINEPLPNLKIIQKWILIEILEHCNVSVFAKAYRKKVNIKENVKFHRGQKIVMKLDIKNFFNNLKPKRVLSFFSSLGYSKEVSVVLTKLCTLNGGLPQGAATSPILSNILMIDFDKKISDYCKSNKIRYTRYADDLSFSGDFDAADLYFRVERSLHKYHLIINKEKTKVMRAHNRQIVTGIVVNDKIKVSKAYRSSIRQEMYYILRFNIDDHLSRFNRDLEKKYYLKSLKGRIKYCLFIDSKDVEMMNYLTHLNNLDEKNVN